MALIPRAEWYFRSSLDRYIWIFGMLCGWAHPLGDGLLQRIDALSLRSRVFVRALILAATAAVAVLWCAISPKPCIRNP